MLPPADSWGRCGCFGSSRSACSSSLILRCVLRCAPPCDRAISATGSRMLGRLSGRGVRANRDQARIVAPSRRKHGRYISCSRRRERSNGRAGCSRSHTPCRCTAASSPSCPPPAKADFTIQVFRRGRRRRVREGWEQAAQLHSTVNQPAGFRADQSFWRKNVRAVWSVVFVIV